MQKKTSGNVQPKLEEEATIGMPKIKRLQRSKNAPRRDMFEDKKKKQGKR
jgi:hypothetical protein